MVADPSRYAQERKFYADKAAVLLGYGSISLRGDLELKRLFLDSRADLRASGVAMLDRFTSTLNTEAIDSDTPIYYVDNPYADQKPFAGRWRLVRNEQFRDPTDPNLQGIAQTLRKGYLETISTDATTWTEARLVGAKQAIQDATESALTSASSRVFKVQFRNVSPFATEAILNAFVGVATLTDPVIEGKSWVGTFSLLYCNSTIGEDGSAVIEFLLADSRFQVTSFDNLLTPKQSDLIYLYGVAKTDVPDIIATWKALAIVGSTATVSYNKDDELVDLILRKRNVNPLISLTNFRMAKRCNEYTIYDIYFGLTKAQVEAYAELVVPVGQSWTVRPSYDQSDGTWTVEIEKHIQVAQDVDLYVSASTPLRTTTTAQYLGSPDEDLYAEFMDTDVAGFQYQRKVVKLDNCLNDVTLAVDFQKAKISPLSPVTMTALGYTYNRFYRGLRLPFSIPTFQTGYGYAMQGTYNESGVFDGELTEEMRLPFGFTRVTANSIMAYRADYTFSGLSASVPIPSTVTAGAFYSLDDEFEEKFGTYRGVLRYTQAMPTYTVGYSARAGLSNTVSEMYTGYLSLPVIPAAVQGTVVAGEWSIDDTGGYRMHARKATSVEGAWEHVEERGPFSNSTFYGFSNFRTLPTIPHPGIGRYRMRAQLQDDHTYSGQVQYSVPDDGAQFKFVSKLTGLDADYSFGYKNIAAPIDAPGMTRGRVHQARFSVNEDGGYDGLVEETQSFPTIVSFERSRNLEGVKTALAYENSPTQPEIPAGRSVGELAVSLNPDYTYRGTLEVFEANEPVTEFSLVVTNDIERTIYQRTVLGAGAYEDAEASGNGALHTVTSNLDVTTGLYHNVIQSTYAKSRATFGESYSRFQKTTSVTDLATLGADYTTIFYPGFYYSKTLTPNGDGTYQRGLSIKQGVAFQSERMLVDCGIGGFTYHTIYRNQATPPTLEAPEQTNYSVQLRNLEVNDFQLYDFTKVEEQPHAPANFGEDVISWVENLGASRGDVVTYPGTSDDVEGYKYISAYGEWIWYKVRALKYFPTAVTAAAWISGFSDNSFRESGAMFLAEYSYRYGHWRQLRKFGAPYFADNRIGVTLAMRADKLPPGT